MEEEKGRLKQWRKKGGKLKQWRKKGKIETMEKKGKN